MPNPTLSPEELSTLRTLLQKAGAATGTPVIIPKSMTPEEFQAHVEAANAETARNAKFDADPRAAHFALEARVEALEALASPPVKAAVSTDAPTA